LVDLELTWRNDIKAPFALGEPVAIGWAVARHMPKLLEAIDEYFEKTYRGTFYNLTYQKYFKDTRTVRGHVKFRAVETGQLSPYDDAVRRFAKRYGFDWRLITAQMYQDSRFNPNARSWAGARGLMQVIPSATGSAWPRTTPAGGMCGTRGSWQPRSGSTVTAGSIMSSAPC
jgi:membrane-bound lytic murein transglycosylase F